MQVSRRTMLAGSVLLPMAGLAPFGARAADDERKQLTPDEALLELRRGNKSFIDGKRLPYRVDDTYRRKLALGQLPFASIVCCSDSRAAPEQIFQVGLGEVFVVRNAGSTLANPQALGSVEYSVHEWDVPLVVVLGHSQCGAVKEAINIVRDDAVFPPTLEAMLLPLLPSVLATRKLKGNWIDNAVRENVRRIAARLRACDQPILSPPQRIGELKIVGAVYDLETGIVDFFDLPPPPDPCVPKH